MFWTKALWGCAGSTVPIDCTRGRCRFFPSMKMRRSRPPGGTGEALNTETRVVSTAECGGGRGAAPSSLGAGGQSLMEGSVYPVPAVGGTWSRCCHLKVKEVMGLTLPHISGVLVPPSGAGLDAHLSGKTSLTPKPRLGPSSVSPWRSVFTWIWGA